MLETEESLVEKERRGDAVEELDGGLHAVERVVVGEEDLGKGVNFRGLRVNKRLIWLIEIE